MKDIGEKIKELEKLYLSNCTCKDKNRCCCSKAAEIRAYLETVIPEPFYDYTIKDFNGRNVNSEKILSTESALKAKSSLLKYCWENISIEDLDIIPQRELDKRSIIDKRLRDGTNVVIYSKSNDLIELGNRQKGKTFIASLIMREAIISRYKPNHSAQSYAWIDFTRLKNIIAKKDEVGYQSCDWLVVDDIKYIDFEGSARMKAFISDVMEPFFNERSEEKLPTVFVFKFDITKPGIILDEQYGATVSKIVEDPKTFKIELE